RSRVHLRRYRDLLGRRSELALAGRDDQDRRHQARGTVHPGVIRRQAVFHLRDHEGPISAGWSRTGGVRSEHPCLPPACRPVTCSCSATIATTPPTVASSRPWATFHW